MLLHFFALYYVHINNSRKIEEFHDIIQIPSLGNPLM